MTPRSPWAYASAEFPIYECPFLLLDNDNVSRWDIPVEDLSICRRIPMCLRRTFVSNQCHGNAGKNFTYQGICRCIGCPVKESLWCQGWDGNGSGHGAVCQLYWRWISLSAQHTWFTWPAVINAAILWTFALWISRWMAPSGSYVDTCQASFNRTIAPVWQS